MAKIKAFDTHKGQARFICEFNAGVQILNDGTIHLRVPKNLFKRNRGAE